MKPSEKGAFCQKCALEVIDFTHKTPIEIKQLLVQNFSQNSRTCGRITNYQLDQLNDEFFHWKSEQEMFRAVWIFSLLAAFGLTLFSCQNTLSKELISKLNVETSLLLNPDSTIINLTAINDTTLLQPDSLNNSSNEVLNIKSSELEIVTWMGIMPYNKISPWITCFVSMGNFIISGSISAGPKSKEFIEATSFPHQFPIGPNSKPLSRPSSPIKNPPTTNNSQKIEGIFGSGDKKFDAFVSPNPITSESRVYINVHESFNLSIDIYKLGSNESFRSGSREMAIGFHSLNLNLHHLSKGEYQLKLLAFNQLSVLDFVVTKRTV